ncbi:MAG TPA: PIG-L family deacetylase [Nitrospirae bacterium]|nr:PIG-L family deacetylase [Nitrospirota bacterium]
MIKLLLNPSPKQALKILCLGAHSDDIEIGCGGTLLKLIDSYPVDSVRWIVFCSDEIRRKEAEKSASLFLEEIKQKKIEIKEFRDGFLPYIGDKVKEVFEKIKSEFDPDIIFTHYRYDLHQDHRLICELTWNTFRDHFILEYEIPKYDGDLGRPNFFAPLDKELVNRKIDILLDSFKSQSGKHWFDRDTFQAIMRIRGMESATAVDFAEAFYGRKAIF